MWLAQARYRDRVIVGREPLAGLLQIGWLGAVQVIARPLRALLPVELRGARALRLVIIPDRAEPPRRAREGGEQRLHVGELLIIVHGRAPLARRQRVGRRDAFVARRRKDNRLV